MYLQQIIIRSLSGFLFLAPGMLLYFWVQSKRGRKQPPLHEAGCLLFEQTEPLTLRYRLTGVRNGRYILKQRMVGPAAGSVQNLLREMGRPTCDKKSAARRISQTSPIA